MEDFTDESRYAVYSTFAVGAEVEKYKLTIGAYSGTAGNCNLCQNINIIETYIIEIQLCFGFTLKKKPNVCFLNKIDTKGTI